ncbi:MAG: aldo/keto reductase [Clostridia bacterium]|nr:aldo/keto reductase [Clostridia bacterium]
MQHDIAIPGTDLQVSPVALGTVKAATWMQHEADTIFNTYLEHGGNIIDTARVYTPPSIGVSEERIGQWLRSSHKRNQVVLVTKGGHPDVQHMHTSRMDPAAMRRDLEQSLRALCTETIDLYLYHRDDEHQSVGKLLECMEQFRREGKIRWYGCSNWRTSRLKEAWQYAQEHDLRGFAANQCEYNVGVRYMKPAKDDTMVAADEEMLSFHEKSQFALMAYCSLCGGFFHKLSAHGVDAVREKRYLTEQNLKVADRLAALQAKYHASLSQVELGFLLTQPFPTTALAGVSNPEQLYDLMNVQNIPFMEQDYQL